ncbi:hypothetical protein KDA11_06355 [Candidatus Saccharibacteria bacterium]|nr:hypothetical protein [Candidatus Saccharibacteria bacterium]
MALTEEDKQIIWDVADAAYAPYPDCFDDDEIKRVIIRSRNVSLCRYLTEIKFDDPLVQRFPDFVLYMTGPISFVHFRTMILGQPDHWVINFNDCLVKKNIVLKEKHQQILRERISKMETSINMRYDEGPTARQLLAKDPARIKFFHQPSAELQMFVLKIDWRCVEHIRNLTEEAEAFAMSCSKKAANLINNPRLSSVLLAIKKYPIMAICYPKWDEFGAFMQLLQANERILNYLPYYAINQDALRQYYADTESELAQSYLEVQPTEHARNKMKALAQNFEETFPVSDKPVFQALRKQLKMQKVRELMMLTQKLTSEKIDKEDIAEITALFSGMQMAEIKDLFGRN